MISNIEMLRILSAAYIQWPYVKLTEDLVIIWQKAFEGYEANEVGGAVMAALKEKTGNGHLTISDVFRSLQDVRNPDLISEREAWDLLQSAVRHFGWPNELKALSHLRAKSPKLEAAVRAMGWRNICEWRSDDESANRAHFWRMMKSDVETRNTVQAILGPRKSEPQRVGDILKTLKLEQEAR